MLHHVSFSVRDPARAASLISQLVGATAVKAPAPPFPVGSWFVIFGDTIGTLIELTPWGSVLAPDTKGIGNDPEMRAHSASHVLVGTPLSATDAIQLAERNGLRAGQANAGLFQFVKVWIEDSLLLELLPPEFAPAYQQTFGSQGVAELDTSLRALEQEIAGQLAAN